MALAVVSSVHGALAACLSPVFRASMVRALPQRHGGVVAAPHAVAVHVSGEAVDGALFHLSIPLPSALVALPSLEGALTVDGTFFYNNSGAAA